MALGIYGAGILLLDVGLVEAEPIGAPSPFSEEGAIAAGLVGLLIVIVVIFSRYELPAGVRVPVARRRSSRYAVLAVGASSAAAIIVFALLRLTTNESARVPFLGGLESRAVLFVLVLMVLLWSASRVRSPMPDDGDGETFSVAFLIPAHNEAQGIASCIRALDDASAEYGGRCRAYLIDNGSVDGTATIARGALADCRSLVGVVLECPTPGKSHALNFGLDRIVEDIVVRIDADTLVEPSLLRRLLPYFRDPVVGGVSGLPLPKPPSTWLTRIRLMEVFYNVAFVRIAQGALDAIMVMPGVLASYRRDILERLGGFGAGFNGEDADVTVRIGRLGYRIVSDPRIRVYTEVPATLAHLHEQRQRWARGLFHMAARNLSSIWMLQGIRGSLILPWAVLNASRRALMLPVLACAGAVEATDPSVFDLKEVAVVGGFFVGLQLLLVAVLLLLNREFKAIPYIPAYLIFRIFRAYVALEALLSMPLRESAGCGAICDRIPA